VEEDVLDVFADVAGLGEGGGVGDRERHIQQLGERLREVRLTDARRPDEEDVRLLELDIALGGGAYALVVVVDRDGEDLLGLVLADDVLVQVLVDEPGGDVLQADGRPPFAVVAVLEPVSSSMISRQTSTHSSQI
jgi:hypothetical protein